MLLDPNTTLNTEANMTNTKTEIFRQGVMIGFTRDEANALFKLLREQSKTHPAWFEVTARLMEEADKMDDLRKA